MTPKNLFYSGWCCLDKCPHTLTVYCPQATYLPRNEKKNLYKLKPAVPVGCWSLPFSFWTYYKGPHTVCISAKENEPSCSRPKAIEIIGHGYVPLKF